MELELDGKVILVTGGSDGLGRALCMRLVEEGVRVALCAREPDRLREAARVMRARGGEVLDVVADVTEPADLERFVTGAMGRFGRIDGLVNNAGRSAASRVIDSADADWEDDLALKVFGAVRLTRLVLPYLATNGGAIVNVLAIGAKAPGAGSTPTTASRAAGLALSKALSKEAGPDGIRVNAVLIGLVESGQWARRAAEGGREVEDLYAAMARDARIPLGRVGRAEEFADLCAYLLSARASYVSGAAVTLDGGLSDAL